MKYADRKENFVIFSDKAKYNKIEEVFITFGNSKAEHNFNRLNSSNFKFDKKNILTADKNVEFLIKRIIQQFIQTKLFITKQMK